MCGRFVISSSDAFGLKYETSYNVVPSQLIPVKMKNNAKLMKWSYAPLWKKDMNLINCRSETMDDKPSFKNAKRCIIFNNGWYEWQRTSIEKIPFYHYIKNDLIHMAGIYNDKGCAIVTTEASINIKHIHHRQPLLLEGLNILNWVDEKKLISTNISDKIQFYPVSRYVNYPSNNDARCIQSV